MAALMVPQVLSTITASFAPEERPKAFGIFGAAIGISTVGAPLLGGALVEADIFGLGWRPIFLINVPVGVATFLLARSYPLVQGHELGWPAWTFALMAAAVPAGAAFVVHQARRARAGRDPLVPLALFRERAFAGGVLTGLTFFSGVAGFFLMTTIALQQGLGKSPLETAVTYARDNHRNLRKLRFFAVDLGTRMHTLVPNGIAGRQMSPNLREVRSTASRAWAVILKRPRTGASRSPEMRDAGSPIRLSRCRS